MTNNEAFAVRKELAEILEKKIEGLHQGVIFWISPIGHNLEHRMIYSDSYCEVSYWLDENKDKYKNVACSMYIDGVLTW